MLTPIDISMAMACHGCGLLYKLGTQECAVCRQGNFIIITQCKSVDCSNMGRYDSGYCGLHDIEHNQGKGKRVEP